MPVFICKWTGVCAHVLVAVHICVTCVRVCARAGCLLTLKTITVIPFVCVFAFKISDFLAWNDLADDALEKKLVNFTHLYLPRLPPRVFCTLRDESFDTAQLNSLSKTPTIESVACFLHEKPLIDRARVWRGVISNTRRGVRIDSSIFPDEEEQEAFDAWVEEHGSVPRSYSRIRRLPYRVCNLHGRVKYCSCPRLVKYFRLAAWAGWSGD